MFTSMQMAPIDLLLWSVNVSDGISGKICVSCLSINVNATPWYPFPDISQGSPMMKMKRIAWTW